MRITASGKPAHTFKPRTPGNSRFSLRLDVYRAVRLLAGPVLAHRVAFGFRERAMAEQMSIGGGGAA